MSRGDRKVEGEKIILCLERRAASRPGVSKCYRTTTPINLTNVEGDGSCKALQSYTFPASTLDPQEQLQFAGEENI